jgi:predicted translin family RNA/ssDNA-binding protein
MIKDKFLAQLKNEYQTNEAQRRQIISAANGLLFTAKKTIFALQRQDFKLASTKLAEIEDALKNLESRFGAELLQREGAYKAAVEEYLEGKTFYAVIKNKPIEATPGLHLDYEGYLGGLCDLIGELVRYATNQAAGGKFSEVAKIKKLADAIMDQLIDFDLTGYLRTKYDQARGHLRKLEQMAYDLKLRHKK